MNDLEIRGHDKQNSKRGTQFGVMSQKLCPFEVPCTLGNDLIISPQPFIRCSWSWTFWKWEREVFNFPVGKYSFEASLMLESWVEVGPKPFHFWKFQIIGQLLFWEILDLTSNSSMWVFEMSNETCLNMNEVSLITSHLQIHSWLCSWLLWASDNLGMHWWI